MSVLIPQPTTTLNSSPDFSALPGVSGYEMTYLSSTTFKMRAGYASGQYNVKAAITYPPLNAGVVMPSELDFDTSLVGALGCYPVALADLTLANVTTFAVYALIDTSGVNKNLSTGQVNLPTAVIATGDNFLLPGYDSYERIGLLPIAADGTILPFIQTGSGTVRKYALAEPILVLDAGASSTQATIDLSAADGPVPAFWTMDVDLVVDITPDTTGDAIDLIPHGLTFGTVAPYGFKTVASGEDIRSLSMPVGVTTTNHAAVDYKLTSGDDVVSVYVSGWTDNMMINKAV